MRANESLHLRRLLRVVEHGASLLETTTDSNNSSKNNNGGAGIGAAEGRREGPTSTDAIQRGGENTPPVPSPTAAPATAAAAAASNSVGGGSSGGTGVASLERAQAVSPSLPLNEKGVSTKVEEPPSKGMIVAMKLARVFGGVSVLPPSKGGIVAKVSPGGLGRRQVGRWMHPR